jgi:hypothetical protein
MVLSKHNLRDLHIGQVVVAFIIPKLILLLHLFLRSPPIS